MSAVFARLLRLEIGFLLRQPSVWWLFLPLTAALLIAAHLGAQRVEAQQANIAQGYAEERRIESLAADTASRLAQPSAPAIDFYRDPTGAYSYMTMFLVRYAAKEPFPLAPLAIGQADVQPSTLRMTFGFSAVLTDDYVNIGSARALKLGGFDLAFVLVYLLPLALIAVSAPRMSFEQDSGIIRMIAAQPLRLATVAATKFGAVAVAYLLWLILAGGSALWVGGVLPGAAGWGPTLGWIAASIALYGVFWIGVGALGAALWRGGKFAIGFAFAIWAIATVLLPAAAALIIEAKAAPVSRVAYIDTSRQAVDHFYEEGAEVASAWASAHPRLADRPDLAVTTEVMRLARDDYFRTELAPFRQAFDQRQVALAAMEQDWAIISPSLILRRALQTASGGDTARHASFLREADDFGQRVRAYFEPVILGPLLTPPAKCDGCLAQLNYAAYPEVPRFTALVDNIRPRAVAKSAAFGLAIFVVVLALLLGAAFSRKKMT